jgi:transcriptional regulator with XRE-family HTH domain
MANIKNGLGEALRQQREAIPLTLQELAKMGGVSPSHLGRIERGERYPSARILRKIAKPLGFEEDELFTIAGFLSPQTDSACETRYEYSKHVDPYVAKILAQEPVEVQRTVIGILSMLKSIAKSVDKQTDELS